jgi:hypothetical protein
MNRLSESHHDIDLSHAIEDMLSAADSMNAVFAVETEALERFDAKAFLKLQDSKLNSARRYQQSAEIVMKHRADLKNLGDDVKARLEAKQAEFAALGQRNMTALHRMQKATERFGDTLRNAAKDAVRKTQTFSYGQSGIINESRGKGISMGLSETA